MISKWTAAIDWRLVGAKGHLWDTETRVISVERILGSNEFIEMVLKSADEAYEWKTVIQADRVSLNQLIGVVAATYARR